MKRIISICLSAVLFLTLLVPVSAADSIPFTDVAEKSWYFTYVRDLYNNNVIAGTTPTTFTPNGTVTTGQALKMILLAAGYDEQEPITTHWASGYYKFADKNGILPKNFYLALDDSINRLMIAQITASAMNLSRTQHTKSPFIDTTDASVLALYDYGIVNGSQNANGYTVYNPNSSITRAEISAIVWRILQLRESGEVPPVAKPETPPAEPDTPPQPETPPESVTPSNPNPPANPPAGGQFGSSSAAPGSTSGGESFTFSGQKITISNLVAPNPYTTSCFQPNELGYMTYTGSGYSYKVGIDVSKYQGKIDWAKVKEAGIDFAIVRVGLRGYGTGKLTTDAYYKENIEGALANGIEVGVYFFSQAINAEEGREEALYTLSLIQNYNITYPIVFDWEPYSTVAARTDNLDDRQLTAAAVAFCKTVADAGYEPMLYSNLSYFYLHFDIEALREYPFWLAYYSSKPRFYYTFAMWQYGTLNTIPGIKGSVDMNIALFPN